MCSVSWETEELNALGTMTCLWFPVIMFSGAVCMKITCITEVFPSKNSTGFRRPGLEAKELLCLWSSSRSFKTGKCGSWKERYLIAQYLPHDIFTKILLMLSHKNHTPASEHTYFLATTVLIVFLFVSSIFLPNKGEGNDGFHQNFNSSLRNTANEEHLVKHTLKPEDVPVSQSPLLLPFLLLPFWTFSMKQTLKGTFSFPVLHSWWKNHTQAPDLIL